MDLWAVFPSILFILTATKLNLNILNTFSQNCIVFTVVLRKRDVLQQKGMPFSA